MVNDDFLYIYKKRLNKFGNTYAERIQGKREKNFEHYLNKTVYLVSFELNGEEQYGSLEKYRQDETQTLSYLLTRIDIKIPSGTIIETINKTIINIPISLFFILSPCFLLFFVFFIIHYFLLFFKFLPFFYIIVI